MNKTYEELAKERDSMKHQLIESSHMKGHTAYKMLEDDFVKKQQEIKNWIKGHPLK